MLYSSRASNIHQEHLFNVVLLQSNNKLLFRNIKLCYDLMIRSKNIIYRIKLCYSRASNIQLEC